MLRRKSRGIVSVKDENDSGLAVGADGVQPISYSSIAPSLPVALERGELIAGRFVIESVAGTGGMGVVYRATDRDTTDTVAVKVVRIRERGLVSRFLREADVLEKVSHPSIVRYVARGTTEHGAPFLAMEWLSGEDLAQRLSRARLSIQESLLVLRQACEGVAAAHALGVVHRDIKPSNLFLIDANPSSVKLLDFGIARQLEGAPTLSQAGTLLGTVGYMAPEQALAAHDVDARADVFALGCVLFECLTGHAAFRGPNPVAVLARVLRDAPPRVGELCPGVSTALEDLVNRMLAKEPRARPEDAAALLRELDAVEREPLLGAVARNAPEERLSDSEQRTVTVILGKPVASPASDTLLARAEIDESHLAVIHARLALEPIALRGGAWLVVISDRGVATDQAIHAARGAVLLREAAPDLALAVATGRAQTTGGAPVGPVIDRVARLLAGTEAGSIALDELTASLLDPRFEVRRTDESFLLLREQPRVESARLLLGKPTPFVGRERELGVLHATLKECLDESCARATIIVGPPGQGKSRLRQEFKEPVRARGEVRVLEARADPVGAGSAFMLVRQLVRQAVGLQDEPALVQRQTLLEYVSRLSARRDFRRIADFLGELLGLPETAPASPQLRAARDDPQVMGVWLRRTVAEWLEDECNAHPLLLVLEDLHWGDLTSVSYIGEALGARWNRPIMVLALARPELRETFPTLWPLAEKLEMALGRLSARAAEQIIQAVLGEAVDERTMARVVARADGNAFYLEELIRLITQGEHEKLPETVLSLAESRLQRLPTASRRLVRAASVFGESFCADGVAALAGEPVGARLEELLEAEVFRRAPEGRSSSRDEYVFRHGLLRQAAYAMLADDDRATAHRLAGDWLERAGETDALTLADHFELGNDRKRALRWLTRATDLALDGGNIDATITLSERAFSCGAEGLERGILGRMRAAALFERGDLAGSLALGREALPLLRPGTGEWFLCAANLLSTSAFLGDAGTTALTLDRIINVPVEPEPTGPYGWATFSAATGLIAIGQHALACSLVERGEAVERATSTPDSSFVAGVRLARALADLTSGKLGSALEILAEARVHADRSMHASDMASARMLRVWACAEAANLDAAVAASAELRGVTELSALRFFTERGDTYLAAAFIDAGLPEEAMRLLAPLTTRPDPPLVTFARALSAQALVLTGELDRADHEARAVAENATFPRNQLTAFAALAGAAWARERTAEALVLCEKGLMLWSSGGWLRDRSVLRHLRARALHAEGRTAEAREAAQDARGDTLRTARSIHEPHLRESYVTKLPATVSILALAEEWGRGES